MLRGTLMRVRTGAGRNGGERAAQWRGTGYNGWKWRKTGGIALYGVFGVGWYVSIPGGRKPRHGPGNRVGEAFRRGWEGRIPGIRAMGEKIPGLPGCNVGGLHSDFPKRKTRHMAGFGWEWMALNLPVRSANPPRHSHPVWRFPP